MTNTTLAKKLLIKPGHRILLLNVPERYMGQLSPLPEGAAVDSRLEGKFDCVHLFAQNKAILERDAPEAMAAVKPGGLLWIAYPKGTSKVETDITRDTGWDVMKDARWGGVS